MAVGALFTLPWVSPLDAGAVVPGSKLTFSLTGTSTLANTYSDSALTTPNANPVVADAEGVAGPIYLDPTIVYRVTWATSADVQIRQQDDIVAGQTVSASYRLIDTAPTFYLEETDAAANNGKWRVRVNGEQLSIDVGNDAESSWVQAITIDRTANTVDSVNLLGTANLINSIDIATISSGSFAPSWSGYGTPPSGVVYWQKLYGVGIAPLVMLIMGSSPSATSNSTGLNFTGIPVGIRPSTDTNPRYPCMVIDNGVYSVGAFGFGSPAGSIKFFKGVSDTGFTSSGTKGLPPFSVLIYGAA